MIRPARERTRGAEWEVRHCTHVLPIEVARREAHVAVALRARLFRKDANRAADAVPSEQRALRTAEHLDSVDVERIHVVPHRVRYIDAIDVQRRRPVRLRRRRSWRVHEFDKWGWCHPCHAML